MAKKRIETPKVKQARVIAYETENAGKLTYYYKPVEGCTNMEAIMQSKMVPARKDGKARQSLTQKMIDNIIIEFLKDGQHLEVVVTDVKKMPRPIEVEEGYIFSTKNTQSNDVLPSLV